MKKDYYKQLNIIRLVSCIAILLYHLGVLKGGFLAVCTFSALIAKIVPLSTAVFVLVGTSIIKSLLYPHFYLLARLYHT